ncbi:DNA repair protein RecO [Paludibacter sp. 221]|uniref:DNA repair protein RecO n=1 Tax=Paludibacter sp. 221 TaxID=2302939 RepID=UPI0013D7DC5E|nr:DNA repair protein RecO [Paludibacter sp. 221]
MQIKTTGIVLHTVKYSDSANITTIYTRECGRVPYMVYGANKKKAVCRAAFLQPLSIVDLEVTHHPGKEIQRIKEIKAGYLFAEIPFHPAKNAIALFLSEVLFRVLRQSEPDDELFCFLEESIKTLDLSGEGTSNFHLIFLVKLTRFLGCSPNYEQENSGYFDLINGVFLRQRPIHTHYLIPDISKNLLLLLNTDYGEIENAVFSRKQKIELLESLVEYYKLHIPDFNGLHSLEVLQNVFD